jgi:hypothetical protein
MKLFLKTSFPSVTTAFVLAFGLVACGGGGGGDTTTSNTSTTVATYVPESAELGAFNALQTARTDCGFGAVTRNAQLDAASLAHAKYQVDLSFASGISMVSHDETPGVAGFTGRNHGLRAEYQLYYYSALAEIIEGTYFDYTTAQTFPTMEQRGANSMRNLMNTVYHLSGAMYDGADVGMGAYMRTEKITSTTWREEYRFGSLIGYRPPASAVVLGTHVVATYPCAKTINVPTYFIPAEESPNPLVPNPFETAPSMAGRDFTLRSEKVGPPIYLKVDANHTLTISSYSITQNSTPIPAVLLTIANDPNTYPGTSHPYIESNEAFVVPSFPLVAGKDYTVNVSGTIDAGTINSFNFPVTSFTFTTGQ